MKINEKLAALSDEQFMAELQALTLPPDCFCHQGHVRLAYVALSKQEVEAASSYVCNTIKAFAESLGATRKFHRTMTDAFVRLIAERMKVKPSVDWIAFLKDNPDIVSDAPALLAKHFSKGLLSSNRARTSLVAPDLRPFAC